MKDIGAQHHLLAKKAQVRAEPPRVVGWLMTALLLMVPPALCNVEPKMARKQIGAMTLLKAKKYWTLALSVWTMHRNGLAAVLYLSVRYA